MTEKKRSQMSTSGCKCEHSPADRLMRETLERTKAAIEVIQGRVYDDSTGFIEDVEPFLEQTYDDICKALSADLTQKHTDNCVNEVRRLEAELEFAQSEMNERIDMNRRLRKALDELLDYANYMTCSHETTHRGGVLWEICDDCGAMWADDEGGKPEYKPPAEITNAERALSEEPKDE